MEMKCDMRTNYHAHTARCHHAEGTPEQYVRAAIEGGFDILGFSDHCPWEFGYGFVSGIRMLPEELAGYVAEVRELGEKYADSIKLYCGLECEYYPDLLDWMRGTVAEYGIDYLILGNHFDTDERRDIYFGSAHTAARLHDYADRTTRGMQTGMFRYLAHPDLCFRAYPEFDADCEAVSRELCRCAKALDMPLEYNLLGVRYNKMGRNKGIGYPNARFWEIAAQEGVRCIIGVDAHQPERLTESDAYDEAARYLESLGLERVVKLDFN